MKIRANPFRSTALFVVLCVMAALWPQRSVAQSVEVGPFIEAYAKAHDFNGTVLVGREGKVAYQGSFGLANIPFGVRNTPGTKYRIASITKLFTSVLVLQLQEQGRIDLNGKIADYLPDYAGAGRAMGKAIVPTPWRGGSGTMPCATACACRWRPKWRGSWRKATSRIGVGASSN